MRSVKVLRVTPAKLGVGSTAWTPYPPPQPSEPPAPPRPPNERQHPDRRHTHATAAILQPCQSILWELLYLWENVQRSAFLLM
jgi:hypothetical protein